MGKSMRLFSLSLILLFILSVPVKSYACDTTRTNECATQILFGDSAEKYENNQDVQLLLNALYICSEQSDGSGKEQLDSLKAGGVFNVPTISKINVADQYLLECSHNAWDHSSTFVAKNQKSRKRVLQNTVNEVFDFGLVDEAIGNGKSKSFAATLYYSHILADYLADDPDETEARTAGTTVPPYSGIPYTTINGNKPKFSLYAKFKKEAFAEYSSLDSQGRAGVAYACIGKDKMPPADSRQQIGYIKPSGWNQNQYAGLVNSQPPYLFNRCHLIAHELAGYDGRDNLVTGTRYLNIDGMKPFEDKVARYVRATGNHVLYRSTPVYIGSNLLASGVQLEAYSIEDKGKGICFNVYCYNVQPGVDINYASGENTRADEITGTSNVIPFATYDANESNPDLIFAMNAEFQKLFSDQVDKPSYQAFQNKISEVAGDARAAANGAVTAKQYVAMKQYEYKYYETLTNYVPTLLQREKFFNKVFR